MSDISTMDLLAGEDEDAEVGASFDQLLDSTDKELEWLIPPEQFVDFWIAGIFLLVGAWQVITILFLLTQ